MYLNQLILLQLSGYDVKMYHFKNKIQLLMLKKINFQNCKPLFVQIL
jgi:hypothetical protein